MVRGRPRLAELPSSEDRVSKMLRGGRVGALHIAHSRDGATCQKMRAILQYVSRRIRGGSLDEILIYALTCRMTVFFARCSGLPD